MGIILIGQLALRISPVRSCFFRLLAELCPAVITGSTAVDFIFMDKARAFSLCCRFSNLRRFVVILSNRVFPNRPC